MTTSSVVGIPTGGTFKFIPRDISVGILKPRGCSYHCDNGTTIFGMSNTFILHEVH